MSPSLCFVVNKYVEDSSIQISLFLVSEMSYVTWLLKSTICHYIYNDLYNLVHLSILQIYNR
jgi:hypothetical protein